MGLLFHLCLFIAAISTSAAGPVDKSSKRLGHSIEVRVNPDISDEPSSSDNAFMNPDPTFSVDSDGFSDSLLPTDPNTNPSQSLPTEPYLNGASLSVPEESYYSDGSDQVPNLASVGGILLADANQDLSLREDFQCNSNTAICCKGANNGKTKSCDYWTGHTKRMCTDVHVWGSCCDYWGEVDNASDEFNTGYTCYSGCTGN